MYWCLCSTDYSKQGVSEKQGAEVILIINVKWVHPQALSLVISYFLQHAIINFISFAVMFINYKIFWFPWHEYIDDIIMSIVSCWSCVACCQMLWYESCQTVKTKYLSDRRQQGFPCLVEAGWHETHLNNETESCNRVRCTVHCKLL
jgi:hypothetical protein